ncbi:cation channel [Acrasis kona]|uniref:Cation channel n=1 Tax=Acrasis kona TaxID=1008807 RepID=A0AAW2YYV7_9EUKA
MENRLLCLIFIALIFAGVQAQWDPPVDWDKNIVKKDENMVKCRQWATSFEDWSDFSANNFDITPLNNGMGSAHTLTTTKARSGKKSHMGVITSAEDNQHTGWPSVQLYKNTGASGGFVGGVYIEVWIYLDIEITDPTQWITIGEISGRTGATPGSTFISLDIGAEGYLQLGHVPSGNFRFHTFQNFGNMFPRQKWVNVTTYVDFNPTTGIAAVWQDGVLQSVANIEGGNYRMNQLHFGLYAMNQITTGVVYNDDLTITEVTTAGNSCPAESYIMTLPPKNEEAATPAPADAGYIAWVDYDIPTSGVASKGTSLVLVGTITCAVILSMVL